MSNPESSEEIFDRVVKEVSEYNILSPERTAKESIPDTPSKDSPIRQDWEHFIGAQAEITRRDKLAQELGAVDISEEFEASISPLPTQPDTLAEIKPTQEQQAQREARIKKLVKYLKGAGECPEDLLTYPTAMDKVEFD